MKNLTITLLILVLILPLVSASFPTGWGEYQDDETNTGYMHDITAHWNSSATQKNTISAGMLNHQPLLINFSFNPGQKYLVTASGNYLRAYTVSTASNTLTAEVLVPGSLTTPLSSTYTDGENYVILGNHTHVIFYYLNASGWQQNSTHQISNEINITNSSVRCNPADTDACYFIGSRNEVCELTIKGTNATCTATFDILESSVRNPALSDVDLDGNLEVVWTYNKHSQNKSLAMFDTDSLAVEKSYNFTDGLNNIRNVSDPVIYNFDEGGYEEILVGIATKNTGGCMGNVLRVFKSDFTAYGTTPWTSIAACGTAVTGVGNPTVSICDFGDAYAQACMIGRSITAPENSTLMTCWNYQGTAGNPTIAFHTNSFTASAVSDGLVCADTDTDGIDEVITEKMIYESNNQTMLNLTGGAYDQNVIAGDTDSDNEFEIITTIGASTYVYFSAFTNQPPELNNSIAKGGYFGYMNPACINTSVTFQAQECGGTADCNYENDGSSDQERIVSTCGITGESLENGTFTGSNPTFSCVYNTTGNYLVRLYLQDEFNTDDWTQYNTQYIPITVLNGIPGSTCDIPSTLIDNPTEQGAPAGASTTGVDTAIDDTLEVLFGTSSTMKNIAGIGIVIAIAASAASYGLAAAVVAGIASLIMVTLIGLLSVWILVLIIAVMLITLLLGSMIFGKTV